MSNTSGETNKLVSGFLLANKAYRWSLFKPILLILSLALVAIQIIQYISFLLIINPINALTFIRISLPSEYSGMTQSIAILLFALTSYCSLVLIQVLGESTVIFESGHKPYIRHDIITAFAKILNVGWYIPVLMLAIFSLYYLGSVTQYSIIAQVAWVVVNLIIAIYSAYAVFIITLRDTTPTFGFKQALIDILTYGLYHLGAISFYIIWYAIASLLLLFLSPVDIVKSLASNANQGISLLFAILALLFIVFCASFFIVLSLFLIPAYTIYAALFYAYKQRTESELAQDASHV